MNDPAAAFLLVAFVGFMQGWYTLAVALGMATRLGRKHLSWNAALSILLVLTVALCAVIYAALTQAPQLTGPFAFLPAGFIGSSFAGGFCFLVWLIRRPTRSTGNRVLTRDRRSR